MTQALDDLRERGRIQDVPSDALAVDRLLEDAGRHLATATLALGDGDLAGAYQLAYDAARKSLTGLLLSRGLRARGLGAHTALIQAIRAVFGEEHGIEVLNPLDRMRQVRNEAEYAGHAFDHEEVEHDLAAAAEIVAFASRALERSR